MTHRTRAVVARSIAIQLAAYALLATYCASLPAKQKAVLSLQSAHVVLSEAQDLERGFYAAKTIPNLTPQRHETISRAFVAAFDADGRAAVALRAWNAGDPKPADLDTLMANVQRALTLTEELTAGDDKQSLLGKLNETAKKIGDILKAIGGGQ